MPNEWAQGELRNSSIASLRLRLALLSARETSSHALAISKGEQSPPDTDLLIICKPLFGQDALGDRGKRWLESIANVVARGIPTIIDYTDHHIAGNTPYAPLYEEALNLCSALITSSEPMTAEMANHFRKDRWTIEDAIDTPVVPPKSAIVDGPPTLLWYGHASNLTFLTDYLAVERGDLTGFRLLVLTDSVGANVFYKIAPKLKTRIHCELFEWSIQNMLEAAKVSDWAIIPSDPNHPTKRYVSTNRLITAFAMGLPTAASLIPSYLPHATYFKDIDTSLAFKDWTNLSQISALTKRAQREVLPKYSAQHLAAKWHSCVASYL
jgi:hypothetical protein